MKRSIFILFLLASALSSALAGPFDCKSAALPNGEIQGGEPFVRMNTAGVVIAYRCKVSPNLQATVATWPWIFSHVPTLIQFAKDPSHQRMNETLVVNKTGDWRTDPELREVWLRYKPQMDALK